jgi:hypothetical protein
MMCRLLLIVLLLCVAVPARAVDFFVNADTGDDNAAGTSGAPWRTIPGTRTADDTAYMSGGSWGAITTGNKIACGTNIYLRGGTTQHAVTDGAGRVLLNSDYYSSGCSTSSRMTIKVATNAEWSGSAGGYTIDGNTDTITFPGSGSHEKFAMINIGQQWIQVLGITGQPIRLQNCHFDQPATNGNEYNRCSGLVIADTSNVRVDYVDVDHINYHGLNACNVTNWQMSNVNVTYSQNGGISTGCEADQAVNQGGYVDATVVDSGCGSVACPYPSACCFDGRQSGAEDAFNFSGAYSLWCIRCKAQATGQRGFSGGSVNDNNLIADTHARYRDCAAIGNNPVPVLNRSGSAFLPSGSDWVGTGWITKNYVVGFMAWQNRGGFGAYGGGWLELWNGTGFSNVSGGEMFWLDTNGRSLSFYNTMSNTSPAFLASTSNGALPQGTYTPGVLNNCLRSPTADTQTLFDQAGGGAGAWPSADALFNAPPAWIGATNKVGRANCHGGSAAVSPWANGNTSSYNPVDYVLVAGATAIDAGRFLMVANGSGTMSNTIAVLGNTVAAPGGNSDPNNYFVGTASYLDPAEADRVVQIQNATCTAGTPVLAAGRALVTSMAATSITLDRTCTWADGTGVHLPYNGSAPDMGAFEAGGTPVNTPTVTNTANTPTVTNTATQTNTAPTSTATNTPVPAPGTWSDHFNRASGGLGSNWTQKTWDYFDNLINGNAVVASGGNDSVSGWNVNAPTAGSNYSCAQVGGTTGLSGAMTGLGDDVSSGQDDGAYCLLQIGSSNLFYGAFESGGTGALQVGLGFTAASGDYVAIVRTGTTTFECWTCDLSATSCDAGSDWVLKQSFTANNITDPGQTGIYNGGPTQSILAWGGGQGTNITAVAPNACAPDVDQNTPTSTGTATSTATKTATATATVTATATDTPTSPPPGVSVRMSGGSVLNGGALR